MRNGQILLLLAFAFVARAELNLITRYDVESVVNRRAFLLCKVESDKSLKSVVWYRLMDSNAKKTIYYFEPPRFNSSSDDYKNRVELGSDGSSLVFTSVNREDEGVYECYVTVATDGVVVPGEIPEEASQTMKLTVHVPPSNVKINSFTSNNNMTLVCRSARSKPPAGISWLVERNDEVKRYSSAKTVTEYHGSTADTVGYFYIALSHQDQGLKVYCVINHPETETTLRDDVTMVSPSLLHPVLMHFDWLRGDVPYSTFNPNSIATDNSTSLPGGLVQMKISPSQNVQVNSSVVVRVTSAGSFPQPSYTWWSEDLELRSGDIINIKSLTRNQLLFCLIENPVGRVVMSVQLTAVGSKDNPTSEPHVDDDGGAVSGAMVGAIAFGVLVALLLIAFIVYYCAFKPTSTDKQQAGDFDTYLTKKKLSDSAQPTGQTKVVSLEHEPDIVSVEKQSLLKNASDTPTRSQQNLSTDYSKHDMTGSRSTSSGYGDDIAGSNGVEGQLANGRSSDHKSRAISEHLQDFDENASFVDVYGSTFGLENPSEALDTKKNISTDESDSDASDERDYDSRSSGFEGHYSLPRNKSWEQVDPRQVVKPHFKPTEL